MMLQNQAQLQSVLITVLDHLAPILPSVEYRLVGTSASLLYGAPVPAGDVDFLAKDRGIVDRFAAALQPYFATLNPPAVLSGAGQYYAAYEVAGVKVEASTVEWADDTDLMECIGRGPWEHFQWVQCGEHAVPVVALELRLVTEVVRNREDRSIPLIQTMRRHGCDLALVQRCMEARGVDPVRQAEILTRLEGS